MIGDQKLGHLLRTPVASNSVQRYAEEGENTFDTRSHLHSGVEGENERDCARRISLSFTQAPKLDILTDSISVFIRSVKLPSCEHSCSPETSVDPSTQLSKRGLNLPRFRDHR